MVALSIDPPYLRGEEIQRQPHWPHDVGGIIAAYAAHSLEERFELMMRAMANNIRICVPPCCYISIGLHPTGYVLKVSTNDVGKFCSTGLTSNDLVDMQLPSMWPFNIMEATQRDASLAAYVVGLSALLEPW